MEPDIPTYNISGTIRDIRKAQEEMESAVARFREHSRPVLTDLSMVPVIYDWFRELSAGNGADGARQSDSLFADMVIEGPMPVERRRKFIFVILYLYAPCRLFSGKMPKGLRRAIVRRRTWTASCAPSSPVCGDFTTFPLLSQNKARRMAGIGTR